MMVEKLLSMFKIISEKIVVLTASTVEAVSSSVEVVFTWVLKIMDLVWKEINCGLEFV